MKKGVAKLVKSASKELLVEKLVQVKLKPREIRSLVVKTTYGFSKDYPVLQAELDATDWSDIAKQVNSIKFDIPDSGDVPPKTRSDAEEIVKKILGDALPKHKKAVASGINHAARDIVQSAITLKLQAFTLFRSEQEEEKEEKKEEKKSNNQEEETVNRLNKLGFEAEKLGGQAKHDLVVDSFPYEVKEQTGKKLSKLGSAKVGVVFQDDYIAALQNLARHMSKVSADVAEESKNSDDPKMTEKLRAAREAIAWFKEDDRAMKLLRLEISPSLFKMVTDDSEKFLKPHVLALKEYFLEHVKIPEKRGITVGEESFPDVDPDVYFRVLTTLQRMSSRSPSKDAAVPKAGGCKYFKDHGLVMNTIDDLLHEMNVAGGPGGENWLAYRKELARKSFTENNVVGVFGVQGKEANSMIITYYRPNQLVAVSMTQGGRLPLEVADEGMKIPAPPYDDVTKASLHQKLKSKWTHLFAASMSLCSKISSKKFFERSENCTHSVLKFTHSCAIRGFDETQAVQRCCDPCDDWHRFCAGHR